MTRTTKGFLLAGIVVALLLAGVVSRFASSSPDGLEKVAADKGINANEKDHTLGDSPFADYGTKGLGDGFASGAVAGVAGVAITLAIAGGLTLVLRRRSGAPEDGDPTAGPPRDEAASQGSGR